MRSNKKHWPEPSSASKTIMQQAARGLPKPKATAKAVTTTMTMAAADLVSGGAREVLARWTSTAPIPSLTHHYHNHHCRPTVFVPSHYTRIRWLATARQGSPRWQPGLPHLDTGEMTASSMLQAPVQLLSLPLLSLSLSLSLSRHPLIKGCLMLLW